MFVHNSRYALAERTHLEASLCTFDFTNTDTFTLFIANFIASFLNKPSSKTS
jgi:hypothetical protein